MTMRDPRMIRPRPFHPAPEPILPHIDDVCMAFHRFQSDAVQAMHHRPGSREQTQAFKVARDKLRVALKELSLYQHIDWTEK